VALTFYKNIMLRIIDHKIKVEFHLETRQKSPFKNHVKIASAHHAQDENREQQISIIASLQQLLQYWRHEQYAGVQFISYK